MPKRTRKVAKATAPVEEPVVRPSFIIDMEKIFSEAQHDSKLHIKYAESLKLIYTNENVEEFHAHFKKYLRFLFTFDESVKTRTAMGFVAYFIHALNSVGFQSQSRDDDDDESTLHPLFELAVNVAIEATTCDSTIIRTNSILLVSKILDVMEEDATINDELFNKIAECLIERSQDTIAKVRQYAIEACKRLQQPNDPNDPIITIYMFHIKFDQSYQVRKAVLKCLSSKLLYHEDVISRVADPNPYVRLEAFMRYEKIILERLRISDRQEILRRGLVDPDKRVKKFVTTQLVWSWIELCNKNVIKLLNLIRLDSTPLLQENYDRTVKGLMEVLFEKQGAKMLEYIPFKPKTKLLEVTDVSLETILLWKHVVQHLSNDLEASLPELKAFVDLFKEYRKYILEKGSLEDDQANNEYNNTCFLFYEIMLIFEVDDEVGREYLVDTLLNILKVERPQRTHVKIIVRILKKAMLKFNHWHDVLIEIINDIFEPYINKEVAPSTAAGPSKSTTMNESVISDNMQELYLKRCNEQLRCFALEEEKRLTLIAKNYKRAEEIDNEITKLEALIKALKPSGRNLTQEEVVINEKRGVTKDITEHKYALQILHGMLTMVNENTPSIHILAESMLLPYMRTEDESLLYLIIICIGSMSLGEYEVAKKYFIWLYDKIFDSRQTIWEPSLKMIIDIFRRFGIDDFICVSEKSSDSTLKRTLNTESSVQTNNITETGNVNQSSQTVIHSFIETITHFLLSTDINKQAVAVSGLVKLFLHEKISSKLLLARLLILWFHPDFTKVEYNKMRQQIGLLFSELSAGRCLGQEALAEVLIPVIKILIKSPDETPLAAIAIEDVIKFIVEQSKPSKDTILNVHNMIALRMCNQLIPISELSDTSISYYTENLANAFIKALCLCAQTVDDDEIKKGALKCCDNLLNVFTDNTTIVNNLRKAMKHLSISDVEKTSEVQPNQTLQTNRTSMSSPQPSTSGRQPMEANTLDKAYESEPLFSDDD